jgi:hypothetical protein
MHDAIDPREVEVEGFTVKVRRLVDIEPDLSYLGKFTNRPKLPYYDRCAQMAVLNAQDEDKANEVFEERGWSNREYRYIDDFAGIDGSEPNEEQRKHIEQAAKRLEDYDRGEWQMLGVVAEAYREGVELGRSTGLWGIESDSDESYFAEVEQGEINDAVTDATRTLEKLRKG